MVSLCKKSLKFMLISILVFLSVISLIETQRRGKIEFSEIVNGAPIYKEYDNLLWHIAGLGLMIIVCVWLKHALDKYKKVCIFISSHVKQLQLVISILSGLISFLFWSGGVRTPVGDQIQVYCAAQLFNEGNYINLSEGGYVNMYPQQLGYILYIQMVLKIAGFFGFQAIQIINCVLIGGVVYAACCLLNDLSEELEPRIVGSVLFLFLLPLFLMNSWVYGDVPFYFFMFICLHNYVKAHRTGNIVNIVAVVVSAVFCVIFRKHALIVLVAVAIVSIV